jgi:hypothetical protein
MANDFQVLESQSKSANVWNKVFQELSAVLKVLVFCQVSACEVPENLVLQKAPN